MRYWPHVHAFLSPKHGLWSPKHGVWSHMLKRLVPDAMSFVPLRCARLKEDHGDCVGQADVTDAVTQAAASGA
jgi:hypothetical protein